MGFVDLIYDNREFVGDIVQALVKPIETSKSCLKCGVEVSKEDKFCSKCGAALWECTSCGTELKPGMKFCLECGTKV